MNKKLIILIAVIAVIAIGGTFAYPTIKQMVLESNPVNHILYSGVQTNEVDSVKESVELGFSIDEAEAVELGIFDYASSDSAAMAKFTNELLKKVMLNLDLAVATSEEGKAFNLSGTMGLNYNDKSLIEINGALEPWIMSFGIPQGYDQKFYMKLSDVLADNGIEFDLEKVDVNKYFGLLKEKDSLYNEVLKNAKKYETPFRTLLEGKVEKLGKSEIVINKRTSPETIPVIKYKLNIQMSDLLKLYSDIFEIAKTDETVKALVLDRINKFETIVLESQDYVIFGLEEEGFKDFISEARTSITDNWETSLDKIIEDFSSQQELLASSGVNQELRNINIAIDKDNVFRQVDIEIKTQFIVMREVVTYDSFGEDVKIDEIDFENNGVDFVALSKNEEESIKIYGEILDNISANILSGEGLSEFLSDLKVAVEMLPEDERDGIVDGITNYIEQIKTMLPLMLPGAVGQNDYSN